MSYNSTAQGGDDDDYLSVAVGIVVELYLSGYSSINLVKRRLSRRRVVMMTTTAA